MRSPSVSSEEHSTVQLPRAGLVVSLATQQEEIREVQRLRYRVFTETFKLSGLANSEALNADEFDDYCDHLLVRDAKTAAVVGTYRLMGPAAAQRMGHYYSEREFDLSGLASLRARTVEAGHACVHPEYRSGSVVSRFYRRKSSACRLSCNAPYPFSPGSVRTRTCAARAAVAQRLFTQRWLGLWCTGVG